MNEETKEMLIAQAKFTLKQEGYFVDNLWHIDDVKSKFIVFDNEDAQDILNGRESTEQDLKEREERRKLARKWLSE